MNEQVGWSSKVALPLMAKFKAATTRVTIRKWSMKFPKNEPTTVSPRSTPQTFLKMQEQMKNYIIPKAVATCYCKECGTCLGEGYSPSGGRHSQNKELRMKIVATSWSAFWGNVPHSKALPIIKHKLTTIMNLHIHRSWHVQGRGYLRLLLMTCLYRASDGAEDFQVPLSNAGLLVCSEGVDLCHII
jgi:hypothetical protein